jgi:hypothetical protein
MIALTSNTLVIIAGIVSMLWGIWHIVQHTEYRSPILSVVVLIYAASFAVAFFHINKDFLLSGRKHDVSVRACLYRALKLWSILVLVLLFSITVHHFIRLQFLERVYQIEFMQPALKQKAGQVTWYWEDRDQQGDLEFNNEAFWNAQKVSLNTRLNAERAQLTGKVDQMPVSVRDFVARTLPTRIINPGGCRRIIRFVCRMIDGYFNEWRSDKIIEAQAWGENQKVVYHGRESELFNAVTSRMNDLIEEGRTWTLGTIRFWFMLFSYLSLVTIVMTALALCKSFAYIFARIFLTENEHPVTLGQGKGRVGSGQVPKSRARSRTSMFYLLRSVRSS